MGIQFYVIGHLNETYIKWKFSISAVRIYSIAFAYTSRRLALPVMIMAKMDIAISNGSPGWNLPQMKALNEYDKNILSDLRETWSKTRVASFEKCKIWVQSYVIGYPNETYLIWKLWTYTIRIHRVAFMEPGRNLRLPAWKISKYGYNFTSSDTRTKPIANGSS